MGKKSSILIIVLVVGSTLLGVVLFVVL